MGYGEATIRNGPEGGGGEKGRRPLANVGNPLAERISHFIALKTGMTLDPCCIDLDVWGEEE